MVVITVGEITGEIVEQARSITAKGGVVVGREYRAVEHDLHRPERVHVLDDESRTARHRVRFRRAALQIPKLLRLHHEGKFMIDELITQEYSLDEVQKGYDDLEAGENIRGVIRF